MNHHSPETDWQDRTPQDREHINHALRILEQADEKIKMQKELTVPPVPDELKKLLPQQHTQKNILWKLGAIAAVLVLAVTLIPRNPKPHEERLARGGTAATSQKSFSLYFIGGDEAYQNFSAMRTEKEIQKADDSSIARDAGKSVDRSVIVDTIQKKVFLMRSGSIVKTISVNSDDALEYSMTVDQVLQE